MPRIEYISKRFHRKTLELIRQADVILSGLYSQGYLITLRSLFYQLVSRIIILNTKRSYDRLGRVIKDARLAGLIDLAHITDGTRNIRSISHWESPADIISTAARSYALDIWATQKYRPEVWIEKDALVGIIEGVCTELDVPFFSTRGNPSLSSMWGAAQRMGQYARQGQKPVVLHLGDHDPTGMDITRDIDERLKLLMGSPVQVRRLGLNWDQVEKYALPPNPTKETDSRTKEYVSRFGRESWELDALDPPVIAQLIRDAVTDLLDEEAANRVRDQQAEERQFLEMVSDRWDSITTFLNGA